MVRMKDNQIYDELHDVVPGSLTYVNGDVIKREDVLGFLIKDCEAVDEEMALIYKCRQVEADKKVESGEAIISGQKLYYYPATENVSPNKTGTYNVDYYYCGTAKKSATAAALTVLMNWNGTRCEENL